jgi:hypothetical protein
MHISLSVPFYTPERYISGLNRVTETGTCMGLSTQVNIKENSNSNTKEKERKLYLVNFVRNVEAVWL